MRLKSTIDVSSIVLKKVMWVVAGDCGLLYVRVIGEYAMALLLA